MTDDQTNALMDLAELVRALCNDCAKDHNIPFEVVQEMFSETGCIYEEVQL